jgi:hypothetical protein
MREELSEAIDALRLRPRDRPWLIPVRLDDIRLPELRLGAGEYLSDLHYVDLLDDQEPEALTRLISAIESALVDNRAP